MVDLYYYFKAKCPVTKLHYRWKSRLKSKREKIHYFVSDKGDFSALYVELSCSVRTWCWLKASQENRLASILSHLTVLECSTHCR